MFQFKFRLTQTACTPALHWRHVVQVGWSESLPGIAKSRSARVCGRCVTTLESLDQCRSMSCQYVLSPSRSWSTCARQTELICVSSL